MQILDVWTKKEYKCPICGDPVFYGKLADNSGKLVTTNGQPPNGKFGKENNVLSGPVDSTVQDRLHKCTAGKVTDKYNQLTQTISEIAINSPQESKVVELWPKTEVKWYEDEEGTSLTGLQSDLYHGYHELNKVAFILTKEQHPNLKHTDGLFGQIASAKATVLSNLLISSNLKKLKEIIKTKSD